MITTTWYNNTRYIKRANFEKLGRTAFLDGAHLGFHVQCVAHVVVRERQKEVCEQHGLLRGGLNRVTVDCRRAY